MHDKHISDIKVTKTLKTEQKTVNILCIASIINAVISFFIEYFGRFLIPETAQQILHIDYLVNIMLGLAASAFISYVSLTFAYQHRKNSIIFDIEIRLKKIFFNYYTIYQGITSYYENKELKYYITVYYFYEYDLYETVNSLIKEIDDEISIYNNSDITSEFIDKINEVLSTKIRNNLLVISDFCKKIISMSDPDKEDDEMDKITKRKSKKIIETVNGCYPVLSETIKNNYSIENLIELYDELILKEDIKMQHIVYGTKKLVNSLKDPLNNKERYQMSENINLALIKHLTNIPFKKEKTIFFNRLNNIKDKINEKNIADSSFKNRIRQLEIDVLKLENEKNIKEIEQLIIQLENDVSNYNS